MNEHDEYANSAYDAGTPAPEAESEQAQLHEQAREARRARRLARRFGPVERKVEARDYMPVRFRRTGRIGCLGGVMYAAFLICLSVVLACFIWMAACDVMALNKDPVSATVVLPEDLFSEVELEDDDGELYKARSADVDRLTDILYDNGVIQYRFLFKLYARLSHAALKVDPGEYALSGNLDYMAVVTGLRHSSGYAGIVTVTIPEGFTMAEIFARLEEEGVNTQEKLYAAAADYSFNYSFLSEDKLGDASRLEGYLFPDTYDFYIGEQASTVINKFLRNYVSRVGELSEQAAAQGADMHEVLTVASLIEAEAAGDEERARIASVIYNRLAAGQVLQIDSTVLYITGASAMDERLMEYDSPYNTYKYPGLPPAPICSPGIASIEAALSPENTGFYFYALDTETGTHRFFATYEEHAAFVATQNYNQ